MATAALPIIDFALTEIPVFLPAVLNAITAVKSFIHKSPGASKMTPEQASAAQTAALALAKPAMITAAAAAGAPLPGDDQTQKYIELVYQLGKLLQASPNAQVAKVGAAVSPTLAAAAPFLALFQTIVAEISGGAAPVSSAAATL